MTEKEKKPAKKAESKKKAAPKKEAKPSKNSSGKTGDLKEAALFDILVRPIVTEKSTAALEFNKVLFKVHPKASKPEIKAAVEKLFGVTVTGVNTVSIQGKEKRFKGTIGRRQGIKKAIVTLKAGDRIDFAAGVK